MAVGHDALKGFEALAGGVCLVGAIWVDGVFVICAEAGEGDGSGGGDGVLVHFSAIEKLVIPGGGDEHGGLALGVPGVVIEVGDAGAPAGGVGLIGDGGHPFGLLIGVGEELLGEGDAGVGGGGGGLGEGADICDEGGVSRAIHGGEIREGGVEAEGVSAGDGDGEGVIFSCGVEGGIGDAISDADDIPVCGVACGLGIAEGGDEDVVHVTASAEEEADDGFVIGANDVCSTDVCGGGGIDELELGEGVDEGADAHGSAGAGAEELAAR